LKIPEIPENAPIVDHWEKAAQRMMNALWRNESAFIFYEPVDTKKISGIDDYFKVIKNPMDFGTVKQNLKNHIYTCIEEFLHDVQLVFNNCLQYNGPDSQVSEFCRNVQAEYEK
jgi:antibiotic biosynthesis monooxygenase (ABM) superfamily enzyme